MVKNEQDIIEPFIRHNIAFLDFMIILNNRSNDATRNIISELMRELGNVVLTDQSDFGYWRSEASLGCSTLAELLFSLIT